jgi:hypothetical protein
VDSKNSSLSRRLESAVTALTAHGALRDRLALAYGQYLDKLDAHDVPEELRGDFTEMATALHRVAALPGDTVIRASVRKLSNDEAQRYAVLIVRLYGLCTAANPTLLIVPAHTPPQRATAPLAALVAMESSAAAAATRSKIATTA